MDIHLKLVDSRKEQCQKINSLHLIYKIFMELHQVRVDNNSYSNSTKINKMKQKP